MKHSYLLIISLVLAFSSCNNDDDSNDPAPVVYKYNDDIKTIIDNNCIICHNNPPQFGALTSLVSYADVKNSVENLGLVNRISRQEGETGLMPNGGPRLSQEDIDKIVNWEANGFLE